ncbi:dehydrase and lipid transport-domain-containing protein [Pseudoneurospora amorphoporcata]|uniref:Dehydrase and lipid transport-domain-containing protein n=1 Tax=Pseudoneurospora amorphoporcata TaxID=241081 RepID=A0AAN6NZK9_9PEZI|nr:dehydrase and lipid transport-domain-containing protein [Pseudoneurospora amorphoporcata]
MPPRPTLLVPPGATRLLLIPRTSAVRSLSSLTTTTTTNNAFNKPTPSQSRRQPPTSVTTTRPYSSWLLSAVSSAASALNNASGSPNGNGGAPETVLGARRILPYPPSHLYNLIADVSSYDQFLPHCSRSIVTAWATSPESEPIPAAVGHEGAAAQGQGQEGGQTKQTQKWPSRGDLTVGWGPFTESYSSRVYCVPNDGTGLGIVEAVSGNASTTIPSTTLQKFGYSSPSNTEKMEGSLFESLVTRWTVRSVPVPGGTKLGGLKNQGGGQDGGESKWTEVALSVRFKFANPALGFAVGQLAGQKVDEMVEAFEERARMTWRR